MEVVGSGVLLVHAEGMGYIPLTKVVEPLQMNLKHNCSLCRCLIMVYSVGH